MSASARGIPTAMNRPVRFGVLGAARILKQALLVPARRFPRAEVVAIAARDVGRARRYAAAHGIPRVHETYQAVLDDADVDAVYIPLPNSLHCEWSIRALEAGKHVLCEKPLAANAREAKSMADAADTHNRLLVEAFHYRYHPLAARICSLVASGEIGQIRHVDAYMCIPVIRPRDIRFRYELGGGAAMDTGCYAVSLVRLVMGEEPRVVRAQAVRSSSLVDRAMSADLRFADATGHIECSLLSRRLLRMQLVVQGDSGILDVISPFLPHLYHHLTVKTARGTRRERVPGDTSYAHQLRAFVNAIQGQSVIGLTDARDGLANMRVIDDLYTAAGMPMRGL